MLEFEYDAIQIIQSKTSKPLILFGAKAVEIEKWAGIPQKKTFDPGSAETSGFQRTENSKRLRQISSFYQNSENVIQNNLICSLKNIEEGSVKFIPLDTTTPSIGKIKISFPDLYKSSWLKLFELLRKSLESRAGALVIDKSSSKYLELKSLIGREDDTEDEDLDIESSDDEPENDSISFEETHLSDFLEDVAIRHELLKELGDNDPDTEKFLGFDKKSLLSFLLPVTLVDGQHRLKGATLAAKELANQDQEEAISLFKTGQEPNVIQEKLELKHSRELPVSLLLENDPKEQVFQFVVINQKATPIGKSLLGTIISTSLTATEMDAVSERLQSSGIVMDDARAITWAARNPTSPFFSLVERGTQSEKKDLLQWNVMGSLIQIFRELRGGKLFHTNNDYAKLWKDKFLVQSDLVSSSNPSEAFDEWRKLDGPWRKVFVVFWNSVKNKLSQDENPARFNYWGNTRKSNIFNKISLTILAADFFKFLSTTKKTINSDSEVKVLVDDWLEDINLGYFDQDWDLSGIKKDSTGIRARWSENWADYRENPDRLPQIKSFRNPRK